MKSEIIRQLLDHNKSLNNDLKNKTAILNKINRTLDVCDLGVEGIRDKIAWLIQTERTQRHNLGEMNRVIETLKAFVSNTPGMSDAEKVQLFKNQLDQI